MVYVETVVKTVNTVYIYIYTRSRYFFRHAIVFEIHVISLKEFCAALHKTFTHLACKFVQASETEGKHGKLFSENVQARSGMPSHLFNVYRKSFSRDGRGAALTPYTVYT
jgi:hypothetical protein